MKLRGLCLAVAFLSLPACQAGEVTGIGGAVGGDDEPNDETDQAPEIDAAVDEPEIDAAIDEPAVDAAPVDAAIDEPAVDAAVGEPDAGPLAPLSFTNDIYPRLQINGDLALACAQCHTQNGIEPDFIYNDGVDNTYERIMGKAGIVVLDNPTQSNLLRRPLQQVGHPVKLFDNVDDPGTADDFAFAQYSIFLRWIEEGAVL